MTGDCHVRFGERLAGKFRWPTCLDFTLLQSISFEDIKQELEPIYEEVQRASNILIRYSRPDSVTHLNSHTFYLAYEGPLPISFTPKEIKVDITIKEKVFYAPEECNILKSCNEFTDLPEDEKILVYSLNEIASEKTVALLDTARTEPRDLYDLWYLTEHSDSVDLSDCIEAIHAKLGHRNKKLKDVHKQFSAKESRLKKTWKTRLAAQMAALPEFDQVYRAVKKAFRQAGISDAGLS